jgi:hypothetical protein
MKLRVIILNIFLYLLLESATVDAESTTPKNPPINLTEYWITYILTQIQTLGLDEVIKKVSLY